jgi:hypothetical protein
MFLLFTALALMITMSNAFAVEIPIWTPVELGYLNGTVSRIHPAREASAGQAFGDLDGDGDLDCIMPWTDGVLYLRNDGTASSPIYTPVDRQAVSHRANSSALRVAVFADLDDDGQLELVIGFENRNGPTQLALFKNTGSGGVPVWTKISDGLVPALSRVHVPCFADIDADGDLDLFVGGDSGQPVAFFRNTRTTQGTWSFSREADISVPAGAEVTAPDLNDIDNDGDLDLFVGYRKLSYTESARPGYILFYRNAGTPQAPIWSTDEIDLFTYVRDANQWIIPRFVDYDNDGDSDVMCGYALPAPYFERSGPANAPVFTRKEAFLSHVKEFSSNDAYGDMDGDGDIDIATTFWPEGKLLWIENEGTLVAPRWKTPAPLADMPHDVSYDQGVSPALVDIDGDGDLDMFVAGQLYGSGIRLYFYRNHGAGNFVLEDTNYLPSKAWEQFSQIAFCDIDADGDQDMFVGMLNGGGGGSAFHFYRNTSQNPNALPAYSDWQLVTTQYVTPLPITNDQTTPVFGDLDRDGDFDLLICRAGLNGPTCVNYFQNIGTPQNATWASGIQDYIPEAFPWGWTNRASLVDIDDDGDLDFFHSDNSGCLPFFRNDAPKVQVYPAIRTVATGASLALTCPGETSIAQWTLVNDRSGGATITPNGAISATYTAGTTRGVVDVVEVTNAAGVRGRAHLNVVAAEDFSASGKAVIMAGRKGNDPLWPVTNNLAHFVYRTLLYRGFSKENIYYLNPVTNQDVDGNGAMDDIDAPSSLSNMQIALTTWAAGTPNLFVYLIDHGQEQSNNVFVRCNETDVLFASELNQWLDALQNTGTSLLTLVVDCCQSGGFINKCHATGGQQRIVIGSADRKEPAFFSAGGLISFTQSFVGALYSGLTIGHAFDLAAGAMDRYQRPQLDDDGNGVYHKDSDGALARTVTLGATFIAGADRPQIGKIVANQSLSGGGTAATIWASDVASVYPVERVWATIAAPNFMPQAQTDPAAPVLGLPELELAWSAPNSRYEATTDTFTMLGAYAVNIYARDIWGGVAYPKQTYINQGDSDEQVIIVCGDGDYDSNSPWAFSDSLAQTAYETALARWLVPDKITYLTSGAHPGQRDGAPTRAALQSAIASAAGATQLTVYLVGKGSASAFDMDGDNVASDPDDVTPAELDAWLDALQNAGPTRVIVILDFNRSGAWMAPLSPPPAGKKRIVVTSCSGVEASWCEEGGLFSFSAWFLSEIFNGVNIRDAFNWARLAVRAITGETQNAQLDDDGSGIGDWRDGALARTAYIGAAFVTGADEPTIGDYARDVPLPTNTATLWASGVWAPNGISEVFAYIVRPGAGPDNDTIDKVSLAYSATAGRWEVEYDSFSPQTPHPVIYFVKDRQNQLSSPYQTTFGMETPTAVSNWTLY